MIPRIFTLCRYASLHKGSMTVIDTFDRFGGSIPLRTFFYIAAKFSLDDNEPPYDEMILKILSLKENKIIFENKGDLKWNKNSTEINMIADFKGLIFESSGKYAFCIFIGGNMISEYKFDVVDRGE